MYIVHVSAIVKPENVDAFKQASEENARNSINEQGVSRFDVIQQSDEPTRFMLIEAYHSIDDAALHKDTSHYKTWRNAVAEMMAEPRSAITYHNIFPDDLGWG